MGANRSGAAGKSIVLRVPVGTQILDEDNETVLLDLIRSRASAMCCLKAAMAASATRISKARPTARREGDRKAGPAKSAGSGCG